MSKERIEQEPDAPISALTSAVVEWAASIGAADIGLTPGLWRGETDEWTVEANGHREEIDGLPFAHFRLSNKTYLAFAILSPFGGCIAGGFPEDELIAHFHSAALRKASEPTP